MKKFSNLPNTDTPINADSLNQFENKLVVVKPTEPTGYDREKVWIEYSKNKLDPTIIKRGAYNSNGEFTNQNDIAILNANVKSNTNYVVSANSNVDGLLIVYFHNNTFIGGKFEGYNVKENKFTTPANCNRVEIELAKNFGTEITQDIVNSLELQLEINTVSTKYEKYLIPNIKVNNNGSYETILYSNNYSTEEQVIGTWIDGKPLYRKVISHTITGSSQEREPHNISNIDRVISIKNSLINQYGYFMANEPTISANMDAFNIYITSEWATGFTYFIIEYTKTTD